MPIVRLSVHPVRRVHAPLCKLPCSPKAPAPWRTATTAAAAARAHAPVRYQRVQPFRDATREQRQERLRVKLLLDQLLRLHAQQVWCCGAVAHAAGWRRQPDARPSTLSGGWGGGGGGGAPEPPPTPPPPPPPPPPPDAEPATCRVQMGTRSAMTALLCSHVWPHHGCLVGAFTGRCRVLLACRKANSSS